MPENIISEREAFLGHFPVPHETIHRLDRYAEMLIEWNAKFNLVAESTLEHIWSRHFLDSAQLMKYIPEGALSLADLGSGAGFPGMVLAIMGAPSVTLVEATGKKADFLRQVAQELDITVDVKQKRIEEMRDLKSDIITARALKPLRELFQLASPLMKRGSVCLFLKGRNLPEELTESANWWKFGHETHQSLSDPSGNVLIIRDLHAQNAQPTSKFGKRKPR